MYVKNLALMALLTAVGTVLYLVVPGYGGGMKPDFMLSMMFIGIILFPNFRDAFLLSVTTGILSGLFTTFPGGFVPNLIDKTVSGIVFLLVVLALRSLARKIAVGTVLVLLGTFLSGSIFLTMALLLTEVPIDFGVLFVTVVLPAAILDAILFVIVFPIISTILKRTKFKTSLSNA